MLASLLIVFREVIEAGLIVGIVLAATKGVAGRGRWVSLGVAAGVLGASFVAAFAGKIAGLFTAHAEKPAPPRIEDIPRPSLVPLAITAKAVEPPAADHPETHEAEKKHGFWFKVFHGGK